MKTLTIGILCGALIALPLHAQTNSPANSHPPEISLCMAVFLLTVSVVAGCVILSIACKHTYCPEQGSTVTVILQKSQDNVNWTSVSTNRIVYDTNAPPMDIFHDTISRNPAFYRVKYAGK